MAAYNVGSFRDRITVLRLAVSELDTTWLPVRGSWAKAERQKGGNIFSSVGLSAESWQFTLRKQDLTMADALQFEGHHHFITAIDEPERGFLTVQAARVRIEPCEGMTVAGPMKFPAALTERYIKYAQEQPMSINVMTYVLVTPKQVMLSMGSLVSVLGAEWEIQALHELDVFKNEYEIWRRVEF